MAEIINRSPPGLVDALCKRIDSVLKQSSWYEAEKFNSSDNEEYHTPFVHAQTLPISKTESEERDKSKDYPIVQVVCTNGVITDFSDVVNGSDINIIIYFGGYSNETNNQGWRIPMAMLWRVLQDLLGNTILEGYQLVAPVKWTPLTTREPPYYTANLETVWKGSPPAIEVPTGILDAFGDESNETVPEAESSEETESAES